MVIFQINFYLNMKTVGITGGIGSGKSHICKLFEIENAEVFYFDDEAKALYYDETVKRHVIEIFGKDIYNDDEINKQKLSSIIFNNKQKLNQLESLLKPFLMRKFYYRKYTAEYTSKKDLFISESATMMKGGLHKMFDEIIIIDANYEKRKELVIKNRNMSEKDFDIRVSNQMSISKIKEILFLDRVKYKVFKNNYDESSLEFVKNYLFWFDYVKRIIN